MTQLIPCRRDLVRHRPPHRLADMRPDHEVERNISVGPLSIVERVVAGKLPPALDLEVFQPVNPDQRDIRRSDDSQVRRKLTPHSSLPSVAHPFRPSREAKTVTTLGYGKPSLVHTLRTAFATRLANLGPVVLSELALIFNSRRRATSPSLRDDRAAGQVLPNPPKPAARDFDSAELENFPEIIRDKETIARYLDGQGWPA